MDQAIHWSAKKVHSKLKSILLRRAKLIQLTRVAGSPPSVRSGLKRWHNCFVLGLDYNPNMTVPPRATNHVPCLVANIANLGTAGNYLGYVKNFCESRSMSMA